MLAWEIVHEVTKQSLLSLPTSDITAEDWTLVTPKYWNIELNECRGLLYLCYEDIQPLKESAFANYNVE